MKNQLDIWGQLAEQPVKMTSKKPNVDFEPKDLLGMNLTHDIKTNKKKVMVSGSTVSVDKIVGNIEHGMSRFGFTAGQFSLSTLIEYILDQIGPSELYLSTWAASKDGLKKSFEFLRHNKITGIKFMIDTGAKQYRDESFGALLDKFGDCIRTTRIHAKFCVIKNENFNIVIRTSANLNRNTRLECFEIDENKDFADYFVAFFDEAFDQINVGDNHTLKSSSKLKLVIDALPKTEETKKENNFQMECDFS
ncbi:hypothetical protein KAT92_04765 [Candidatus Babeliales bacterium]|nr:hypothetical protein [Candidatus Babeliales bacterium]